MAPARPWRLFACLAAAASVASIAAGCRAATEITLEISTDAKCADIRGTTLSIGALAGIDDRPVTTATAQCDGATGRIGSLVIVPSAGTEDEVAVRVVTALGRDPAECVPPAYGPGCIVARRALRFVAGASLLVPIKMAFACDGIACGTTETCVGGACASAVIADPANCAQAGGCPEGTLGGARPADAGVVAAACPPGQVKCGGACVGGVDCAACASEKLLCAPTRTCTSDCAACRDGASPRPIQCFACDTSQKNPVGTCEPDSAATFCLSGDYSAALGGGPGRQCDCSNTKVDACLAPAHICRPVGSTDYCSTCGESGASTNGLPCKGGGLCNATAKRCE